MAKYTVTYTKSDNTEGKIDVEADGFVEDKSLVLFVVDGGSRRESVLAVPLRQLVLIQRTDGAPGE